jgi:Putative zinc-finger
MTCQMMMSLGVYALGAADAAERRRVEAHLPECPACRAELRLLTPLPALLASVPDEMLATGRRSQRAVGRPEAIFTSRRMGRRWRAAAVAASVAAAAVAGGAGGFWLAPRSVAHLPTTITVSGANPALHMSATAALTATSWGTSIQLRLSGLPLNIECRLIVRSRTGATEVSGVWDAWSKGPISVPASVGWRPSDIAGLEVAAAARNLVTINTAQPGSSSR